MARWTILLVALLMIVGCESGGAPAMTKEQEEKALKGGPMPAGTWDRIAAAREKYNKEHGGNQGGAQPGAPAGPSGTTPATGN